MLGVGVGVKVEGQAMREGRGELRGGDRGGGGGVGRFGGIVRGCGGGEAALGQYVLHSFGG